MKAASGFLYRAWPVTPYTPSIIDDVSMPPTRYALSAWPGAGLAETELAPTWLTRDAGGLAMSVGSGLLGHGAQLGNGAWEGQYLATDVPVDLTRDWCVDFDYAVLQGGGVAMSQGMQIGATTPGGVNGVNVRLSVQTGTSHAMVVTCGGSTVSTTFAHGASLRRYRLRRQGGIVRGWVDIGNNPTKIYEKTVAQVGAALVAATSANKYWSTYNSGNVTVASSSVLGAITIRGFSA